MIVFHCLALVAEQRLDLALLLRQLGVLLAQLHFLEPAQGAQPRVEDIVGLIVGELERAFSTSLGSSSSRMMRITSSRLRKAMIMPASDFEPALDLGEAMARAAQQHVAAMVEPLPQRLGSDDHARR